MTSDKQDALEAAARWFIEQVEEWVHRRQDQDGRFDPRHITHAAMLFEAALDASPRPEVQDGLHAIQIGFKDGSPTLVMDSDLEGTFDLWFALRAAKIGFTGPVAPEVQEEAEARRAVELAAARYGSPLLKNTASTEVSRALDAYASAVRGTYDKVLKASGMEQDEWGEWHDRVLESDYASSQRNVKRINEEKREAEARSRVSAMADFVVNGGIGDDDPGGTPEQIEDGFKRLDALINGLNAINEKARADAAEARIAALTHDLNAALYQWRVRAGEYVPAGNEYMEGKREAYGVAWGEITNVLIAARAVQPDAPLPAEAVLDADGLAMLDASIADERDGIPVEDVKRD